MKGKTMHMVLRLRDMDRHKLFVWELIALRDEMSVGASPHAEKLDRLINRYVNGGDDDRPEEDA